MDSFGLLPDGREIRRVTLENGAMRCEVLTLGAALRRLIVPDRAGAPRDIVLGFDHPAEYWAQDKYIGAVLGRYANRIGGSAFVLGGARYSLCANDGGNHLHGGAVGFDRRVWDITAQGKDYVTLALTSPDGEEGYPGTLEAAVTYRLLDGGLALRYTARCDRETVCNLTNHSYFNLNGHGAGDIGTHRIRLYAGRYTPTDAGSIPTGALAPVDGSPMDLRRPTPIGAHIGDDFPQLRMAGGYDHNFVIDGAPGSLRPAAEVWAPDSGIAMAVYTDQPGIQFYTGNYLDGCPAGKDGAVYAARSAFCLETQCFPDTPNHRDFPSCVLRPGAEYLHRTVFRFSARGEG